MTTANAGLQRVTVIVNRSSGWDEKRDAPNEISDALRPAVRSVRLLPVEKGVDLAEVSRQEIRAGAQAVVAGGGDGTLRAVAEGLVGSDVPMGILPVGTWNHFARDLDVPLDQHEALHALLSGHVASVDVGSANGRVFLNNSIIGLYPTYRFQRDYQERKGLPPRLAFVWAWAKVLWRNPMLELRFRMDSRTIIRRTQYVLIANNEHRMRGYALGARERLDENRLWLYVLRPRGRWGLGRMLLSLLLGRFDRDREFEVFATKRVEIGARQKRLGVALDGEVFVLETPLRYESKPKALRVIAPGAE